MNTIKIIFGSIWLTMLISLGILLISYSLAHSLTYLEVIKLTVTEVQNFIQSVGLLAPVLYIVIYTIRPFIFFPTSILTPLSAVLFGPVAAWAYTYIGENLSATVAFFTARFFGLGKFKNLKIFKKINAIVEEAPLVTVLSLRLVPLFPFDFVNYGMGITRIPYRLYFVGTLLGVIPGLTAYIFLGASLTEPRFFIPTIALFIILISIAYVIKKNNSIIKRIQKQKDEERDRT